jgi:HK97 gp10 family phage protein
MSFSFRIVKRGDRFAEMERRARPEAAKIASTTATVTASVAKQLAPVDTGELRDSIYIEQMSETRFAVGAKAKHAPHVHFGTIYQDSNPFLSIAFEFARKDFKKELERFFKNVSQ